jgi:glutamate--cysteine ligase
MLCGTRDSAQERPDMARDMIDATPIESRHMLTKWLEEGCRPPEQFRFGTEHEKFPFYTESLRPVPYADIARLLEGMHLQTGWERVDEEGRIIGLLDRQSGAAVSLEPAGQFELSGAPLASLHGTADELDRHVSAAKDVAKLSGVGFLGIGMTPDWLPQDMPQMPKARYGIMRRYMPQVGARGLDMMHRTCTVQVNLDFSSEADMVKKLRVSLALQPVATALFANSPFTDGKPNGFLSMRSEIWRDTDADRTGMLDFAFEDGMGFERYVDYALDVPMYFLKRGDVYHDVAGASFRGLLAGKMGEHAVLSDWTNHLTTLFPEVRLKRFLEMRGADAGTRGHLLALPAFWVGLLYDTGSLDAAWDLVKGWTPQQRQALRDDVPRLALKAAIGGRLVRNVAREVLNLSEAGLKARGLGEEIYLEPLREIVGTGKTQAERLLERFDHTGENACKDLYSHLRL